MEIPQFFVPKFMFWDSKNKRWIDGNIFLNNNSDIYERRAISPVRGGIYHKWEPLNNIILVPSIGIQDKNGNNIFACHYVIEENNWLYRFLFDPWKGYKMQAIFSTVEEINPKLWPSVPLSNYRLDDTRLKVQIVGSCFEHDPKQLYKEYCK
jgi:uncharacterized phage protein (TIGR01671 family)